MKVNQLKAGALLSYLFLGLGSVISIIYTPIMLRLLGQSEYGLYNLVASVVGYLGLLNFGFGNAYVKFFSAFKVKNDIPGLSKLNGMFMIIFSSIGFVAVLAGLVLVGFTETILGNELSARELSVAKTLMAIMVVNIAISFPGIVFQSHIAANEKFVFKKTLQIIKVVTSPFLILPILIMGYGAIGMALVTTFLNLGIEIASAWYSLKKLKMKFSFRQFDFSLMREMAVFSSFIFINLVVNQINWNVDRFILGRFHGTVEVATYSLAAQLNTYYLSLSTALAAIFIPRVNKLVSTNNDNRELTSLFTRLGRIQFFVLALIFIGLIFFGAPFIQFWAGTDYADSYAIAMMLIVPVTIPLIQNLGIEIQRAKNKHRFRSWLYLFIAIANVGISIPLAKHYGGLGAAAGTAISLIIGNILIMNWYYHFRIGLNMKYFWQQIIRIFPALLLPVATGFLLNRYFDLFEIQNFVWGSVAYGFTFLISMWLLGLNHNEKEMIINPLMRIKRKFIKK